MPLGYESDNHPQYSVRSSIGRDTFETSETFVFDIFPCTSVFLLEETIRHLTKYNIHFNRLSLYLASADILKLKRRH